MEKENKIPSRVHLHFLSKAKKNWLPRRGQTMEKWRYWAQLWKTFPVHPTSVAEVFGNSQSFLWWSAQEKFSVDYVQHVRRNLQWYVYLYSFQTDQICICAASFIVMSNIEILFYNGRYVSVYFTNCLEDSHWMQHPWFKIHSTFFACNSRIKLKKYIVLYLLCSNISFDDAVSKRNC